MHTTNAAAAAARRHRSDEPRLRRGGGCCSEAAAGRGRGFFAGGLDGEASLVVGAVAGLRGNPCSSAHHPGRVGARSAFAGGRLCDGAWAGYRRPVRTVTHDGWQRRGAEAAQQPGLGVVGVSGGCDEQGDELVGFEGVCV